MNLISLRYLLQHRREGVENVNSTIYQSQLSLEIALIHFPPNNVFISMRERFQQLEISVLTSLLERLLQPVNAQEF